MSESFSTAARAGLLAGVGALVTRTPAQSKSLSHGLSAMGAVVIHHPALAIERVDALAALTHFLATSADIFDVSASTSADTSKISACIATTSADMIPVSEAKEKEEAAGPVGVVWTSANAVTHTLPQLPAQALAHLQSQRWWSACVGKATARTLAQAGITPALIAPRADAESLAALLCVQPGIEAQSILFPCSLRARPTLPTALNEAGAEVSVVPVYRPVAAATPVGPVCDAIAAGTLQLLTFASPSAVEFFLAQLGAEGLSLLHQHRETLIWAAIGSTTADALAGVGFSPQIIAEPPGIPGMLQAIAAHFAALQMSR